MSPVAADKFTCTTSVDVKIACSRIHLSIPNLEFPFARQLRVDEPGEARQGRVLSC
jgi:hypothetical protein